MLRIIGQSLLIIVFVIAGSLLFEFRIPGHQTFTENDALFLAISYGIFIILGLGLLLNSIILKLKNHWSKFRIGVIILVIGFGLAVFLPRDVLKWVFFGEKTAEFTSIENPDFIWVKLELYKNNDFLCSTSYEVIMTEETLGKYEIKDNRIELFLKKEISEHTKKNYLTLFENIGKKYKISNDTLICIDCEKEIKLKKTKPNSA